MPAHHGSMPACSDAHTPRLAEPGSMRLLLSFPALHISATLAPALSGSFFLSSLGAVFSAFSFPVPQTNLRDDRLGNA